MSISSLPAPASSPRLVASALLDALLSAVPAASASVLVISPSAVMPTNTPTLTPVAVASLGLAVDEALGVVALEACDPPRDRDPGWVAGRCRLQGRDIAVLDPDLLLATTDGG